VSYNGQYQRITDAYGAIVASQWRKPVVLHDFKTAGQVNGAWHDFTMCGLDVGPNPLWLNLDILDDSKVRPCRRCWVTA
jgi:hypothetical protein